MKTKRNHFLLSLFVVAALSLVISATVKALTKKYRLFCHSFLVKVLEGDIPDKFEGATLFIDPLHHHGLGAFVVGAAVGKAKVEEETETVVVQEPTYYYQGTPPPDKQSTKSPESKLEDLKSMYDKGLITKI